MSLLAASQKRSGQGGQRSAGSPSQHRAGQHTACSRPNGKALVSCTSPVHPVLFSMHVDAVAHAIIDAY